MPLHHFTGCQSAWPHCHLKLWSDICCPCKDDYTSVVFTKFIRDTLLQYWPGWCGSWPAEAVVEWEGWFPVEGGMRTLKRLGTLALSCSTAPTELHTHCDRVQQIWLTTHIVTHVQQLSQTTHHDTCLATFTDHTHIVKHVPQLTLSTHFGTHISLHFSNHLAHNACMQHSHTLKKLF